MTGIIVTEADSLSVELGLFVKSCFQTTKLIAVEIAGDSLSIGEQFVMDNSWNIPPHSQHDFQGIKSNSWLFSWSYSWLIHHLMPLDRHSSPNALGQALIMCLSVPFPAHSGHDGIPLFLQVNKFAGLGSTS